MSDYWVSNPSATSHDVCMAYMKIIFSNQKNEDAEAIAERRAIQEENEN